MAIRPGRYVSARQEIASETDSASAPATAPTVAVPRAGEKFSDEELHARFNVPVWGGIRVSRERKCIVLVDLAVNSCYEDIDYGRTVSYMGQNSDREGIQDQEMPNSGLFPIPLITEPVDSGERRTQAAGNNLSLARSKGEGYTVLYFTKEWGDGGLRFDSRVECDSHDFEVEQRAGRPHRVVIKFKLRKVEGTPRAAAGMPEPAADRRGAPAGGMGAAVDGKAPWGGNGDAAPGMSGPARHAAGIPVSAQQEIGGPRHAPSSHEPPRRADPPATLLVPREVHARLELGDDAVGVYMRDAITRGGYRAALEYYGSAECEKTGMPWHRFKAKGWLLGRLGLYGQMKSWLEEAVEWPGFDRLLTTANSAPRATYRTPALWLQTPKPAPRQAGCTMAFEPAAAACRDMGAVPDYVWTAMLILDTTGPICSHAGLGAAAHLVAAGADQQASGQARGDIPYDPRRGARLHGAPEGCHRWIIADVDFDPRPPNEPHYYYDLTDEGRAALATARAAGAPWPRATEAAASGLGGMALPDLLERACGLGGPERDLDKMRGEMDRLVGAWRAQDSAGSAPPVSAEDQVLVDLGLTAGWSETGETAGSPLDYLLHIMTIIDSARAVACEAEPSTCAESAVLRMLIAAIQDLCRKHGRAVASALPPTRPAPVPARGNSARQGDGMPQPPPYADATPALISDLYYCLAEYCKSRRLAVDPCSLPLSEVLTDDERAAAIKALMDDSLFHSGSD